MTKLDALITALEPRVRMVHVLRTFDCIKIAEESIATAFPDTDPPEDLFAALLPPAHFMGLTLDVYKAHARELCERAKHAGRAWNSSAATDAETLVVLLASSLKAPLRPEYQRIAEHLFCRAFPDSRIALEIGDRHGLQASDAEALHECRRTAEKVRRCVSPNRSV